MVHTQLGNIRQGSETIAWGVIFSTGIIHYRQNTHRVTCVLPMFQVLILREQSNQGILS